MLDKKTKICGVLFMMKFSYEERLEAVLNIKEKHMSIRAAAKLLGCNYEHLRRWLRRYEEFGVEGLVLKPGTYSGEFKQHVVEYMHENHLSAFKTAVLFGIPNDGIVGKWKNIYIKEGSQALYKKACGQQNPMSADKPKKEKANKKSDLSKEIEEDLIAENQRLRMENAYLKKLNALVQERIARENGKK